jgi:hypothetical protein
MPANPIFSAAASSQCHREPSPLVISVDQQVVEDPRRSTSGLSGSRGPPRGVEVDATKEEVTRGAAMAHQSPDVRLAALIITGDEFGIDNRIGLANIDIQLIMIKKRR